MLNVLWQEFIDQELEELQCCFYAANSKKKDYKKRITYLPCHGRQGVITDGAKERGGGVTLPQPDGVVHGHRRVARRVRELQLQAGI